MSPPTIAVPLRPRPLQIGLRRPAESPLHPSGSELPCAPAGAKGGARWGECRAGAQSRQRSPRPQDSPRRFAASQPMSTAVAAPGQKEPQRSSCLPINWQISGQTISHPVHIRKAVLTGGLRFNRTRCRRSRHPVRTLAGWPKALPGNRCTGNSLEGANRSHRPCCPPVADATPVAGAIPANLGAQVSWCSSFRNSPPPPTRAKKSLTP